MDAQTWRKTMKPFDLIKAKAGDAVQKLVCGQWIDIHAKHWKIINGMVQFEEEDGVNREISIDRLRMLAKYQWQPIETIPKNTPVLCIDTHGNITEIKYCLNLNNEWIYYNPVFDTQPHRKFTHWQPLPQPPKQ